MSYYSGLSKASQRAVEDATESTESVIDLYSRYWLISSDTGKSSSKKSSSKKSSSKKSSSGKKDFGPDFARMRRLVADALGGRGENEISGLLERFSEGTDQVEQAVIDWFDLIETLVQHAEQVHGSTPGKGALKASEVKAVVQHLFRSYQVKIPNIPPFLIPVVIDLVTSWSIDAIALMANQYGLWTTEPKPTPTWKRVLWRCWIFLSKLLKPLGMILARFYVWLWNVFRPRPILPPHLRSALKSLEEEGVIGRQREFIHWVLDTLSWVDQNRKRMIAAAQLIFESVQEAEKYWELSGPEKKAYATDLVFAVLKDMGFKSQSGAYYDVVNSLVSSGIESSVKLFRKRKVFKSGGSRTHSKRHD